MANGAEIARLALVIDGGGARREVKLTTEELVKLANGGKLADDALKKVGNPQTAAGLHRVSDAIKRMREAAAHAEAARLAEQIVAAERAALGAAARVDALSASLRRMQQAGAQRSADAFAARLAIEMDKATESAMRLQRGLEGVRAAQQRMQQAAAQAQATALASRIASADPFQSPTGFDGPQLGPALPAHFAKTADAAQKASVNVNALRQNMTTLAVASGALPGPLGRIGSTLATFAIGGPLVVGVLAGLAAIGFAWRKLTEDSRKAEDGLKGAIERLRELKTQQDQGPIGQTGADAATVRSRMLAVMEEMHELDARVQANPRGRLARGGAAPRMEQLQRELQELVKIEAAAQRQITKINEDGANDRARIAEEEARKREEAFRRAMGGPVMGRDTISLDFSGVARQMAEAAEATEAVRKLLANSVILPSFSLDIKRPAILDQLDEVKREAEATKEVLKGIALGAISGIAGRMGLGGTASGVIGAVTAGAGPMGIAAAGLSGLVGDLIGMGDAAKAAREQARLLRIEHESFVDSQKEALGIISSLDARIRNLNRSFDEQRKYLQDLIADYTIAASVSTQYNDELARAQAELDALNALEGARTAQLKAEQAELRKIMAEDLEVRRLRALGYSEEAELLALQHEHRREMAEAQQQFSDKAIGWQELLQLKEVQRLEEIAFQMDRVKARIASLTQTIDTLMGFRNALRLDATVSPADRLAEAERQYRELVSKATDSRDQFTTEQQQQFAAQIPAAAQAFLEAARQMFGSSPEFQAVREGVLNTTDRLIQQFENMRSVEELMLQELERIRDNTQRLVLREAPLPDPTPIDPNRGSTDGLTFTDRLLQEGFQQIGQKLDAQTAAIIDNTREVRQVSELART